MVDAEKLRDWQAQQRRADRCWNIGQAALMVFLSAIVSWAVSTFATREKPQPPIHVHIEGQKVEPKSPQK